MKRLFAPLLATAGLLLAGLAIASPGQAQIKTLAMLDDLSKGEWTVRYRDGSSIRKVCLRKGDELIQLQHSDANCSRFVVDDKANSVTVQYT